jgi:hypothetical protein
VTANIDPLQLAKLEATPQSTKPAAGAASSGAFATALAQAQQASGPSTAVPPTPPVELASRIDAAAHAWESLAGSGQHLAFEQSPDGRVRIQLRDLDGNDLGALSGNELFELIDREGGT